ncbi:CLUMA_CG015885, isoform A [Clunio marinus]|uniref:CLUMA_CG015885, isoform A n=1 Tax=Clunio marinus TaxID=568069 RepID=A0A1J1IRU6_9DIPT|nr:CLUMA_CG015885, isoform A [Clunio marinus]
MKLCFSFFLILCLASEAMLQLQVFSKKNVTDCSSGTCIDYCELWGEKVLPGKSKVIGCSELSCSKDFSATIVGCALRKSSWCFKFEDDLTLPYPECCNAKCLELQPGATKPEHDDGLS